MSHRIEKINSLIRGEISELLQREIKDPRLGNFITINQVSTSQDLRYAKVFVSCINEQEDKEKILKGLASASGFFHKEMAKNLKLRRVPELSFHWDYSIERGDHLLRLIDQVSSEQDQ
ncbi:30S ribosome-binding factor RbfA [Chloroflexota bacterium]